MVKLVSNLWFEVKSLLINKGKMKFLPHDLPSGIIFGAGEFLGIEMPEDEEDGIY